MKFLYTGSEDIKLKCMCVLCVLINTVVHWVVLSVTAVHELEFRYVID
jgi:hypothetical protein